VGNQHTTKSEISQWKPTIALNASKEGKPLIWVRTMVSWHEHKILLKVTKFLAIQVACKICKECMKIYEGLYMLQEISIIVLYNIQRRGQKTSFVAIYSVLYGRQMFFWVITYFSIGIPTKTVQILGADVLERWFHFATSSYAHIRNELHLQCKRLWTLK
jgi:hypothetical protein